MRAPVQFNAWLGGKHEPVTRSFLTPMRPSAEVSSVQTAVDEFIHSVPPGTIVQRNEDPLAIASGPRRLRAEPISVGPVAVLLGRKRGRLEAEESGDRLLDLLHILILLSSIRCLQIHF